MAITLRNRKVEEQIRVIGAQTGEGPSAVIARMAEAEVSRLASEREQRAREKLARIRAFTATLPKFTDEDRAAAWKDLQEMHDYLYEEDGKAVEGRDP